MKWGRHLTFNSSNRHSYSHIPYQMTDWYHICRKNVKCCLLPGPRSWPYSTESSGDRFLLEVVWQTRNHRYVTRPDCHFGQRTWYSTVSDHDEPPIWRRQGRWMGSDWRTRQMRVWVRRETRMRLNQGLTTHPLITKSTRRRVQSRAKQLQKKKWNEIGRLKPAST